MNRAKQAANVRSLRVILKLNYTCMKKRSDQTLKPYEVCISLKSQYFPIALLSWPSSFLAAKPSESHLYFRELHPAAGRFSCTQR